MKQGSSSRKVNEQAREVIASILLFDISDPELSMVTLTGCEALPIVIPKGSEL